MIRERRPARLFHFTCSHCVGGIRRDGLLVPALRLARDPAKYAALTAELRVVADQVGALVWLTDLEPPVLREAVGLTGDSLACDRTEYCFEVETNWDVIRWWPPYRREHPELRYLEESPGVLPMHWYVATGEVAVTAEVTGGGYRLI